MPLLEIIATEKTSEQTIATAVAFARQLGKMVIVVKDKEGFIVNRILLPYMNEAAYLFQEGVDTKHLDDIVKRFGMPMGPMNLLTKWGSTSAITSPTFWKVHMATACVSLRF